MSTSTDRIAIVSFAGRFPGSGSDLAAFWENVSGAVDCSREVAPDRWVLPPERCTDPRIANPDTVYTTRGYYLDPFTPDLSKLALNAEVVSYLDPLFQLVLDVGNRAWWGAKTEKIDRSRVGVVLGNICLPTDRSSDICREILGPQLGLAGTGGYVYPLNRYVAGMPAGLLATGLGLGGGSFTLDAACASSLYAIKLAADELLAGRADAMLAGGCSRPDCQYTQMGFAQLRALSISGRCSPFDASADGLMVGEGAGIFVLKRLPDALKQGDTIHAVLAGVGLSNDMHGNLLAPAKEGQLRAMRKAYERAGWKPQDVQLIECHATGTPVGDAIEFESLRELWGPNDWAPGQCAIGSVKSTVGHLLTGAGAAAVMKVLLAMKAEKLPPQANFANPSGGLLYSGSPFRVLRNAERWNPRHAAEPRRAAVSGFGFGGVNAHLLLEEWMGLRGKKGAPRSGEAPKLVTAEPKQDAPVAPKVRKGATPVAIVGLAAHFGPWDDLRKFQEHVLSGEAISPAPKTNGWALANEPCPPAHGIEEFSLPIDRFRIPPKELEEALPQQLLMLKVAAAALDDAEPSSTEAPRHTSDDQPTTGCFIGLALDPNTTNFNLRWSYLAQGPVQETGDRRQETEKPASPLSPVSSLLAPDLPPLSANRTMGALGSIAASRIARTFHFGGPSHTVCSEEGSAARAVELGVRALQTGELDRVLVGGVDLACDPRTVLPGSVALPGEGAAAFVLKRLEDAKRDGDRVYAVIRGVGVAGNEQAAISRAIADAGKSFDDAFRFDARAEVGQTGAASAAASLAKAVLALWQELLPGAQPRYWLQDRAAGRRQAAITATGADGTHFAILLEEHSDNANLPPTPERWQPLGARTEAVFVADGDTPPDVLAKLERLRNVAGEGPATKNIEALARAWFRASPPTAGKLAVSLVARSVEELNEQIRFASESLEANTRDPFPVTAEPALRDRVFYSPRPFGPKGKLAFVFPGSGNHFDGMGRDLSPHWPEVLRRQQRENELLRSQYDPDVFWDERSSEATPRRFLFGQVAVGSLVSDILMSLGVKCDAMIGLSLGESAGLFGVRAWQNRDEMYRRIRSSTLFASDLAPPYEAARRHWFTHKRDTIDWVIGIVSSTPDEIGTALRPGLRAYLLMVNTPEECVIGGQRADVEKLAAAIGKPLTLLTGVTLAHCEAAKPVEAPYRELHTLPVTAPENVTFYSGAWGKSYKPGEKQCADSITAGLLGTIDVPNLVRTAYRDGVKVFVEMGPGSSCVRIIESILGERQYLTRSAHAAKQDAVSQILRLVANLAAERMPVDLAALYGCESLCVAHRESAPKSAKELMITVGRSPVSERNVPPSVEEDDAQSYRHTRSIAETDTQSTGAKPSSSVTERTQRIVPIPQGNRPPGEFVGLPTSLPERHVSAAELQSAIATDSTESACQPEDTPTIHQSMSETSPTQLVAAIAPVLEAAANIRTLSAQAQAVFLRLHQGYTETAASLHRFQTQLLEVLARHGGSAAESGQRTEDRSEGGTFQDTPRSLSHEQCCIFAAGKVSDVLGPRFAAIDSFPTRVRLPDGPLQLVDRITLIEGEPLTLARGRVVTEHTVRDDRWYLEAGRIPTALAVEAGQADLFLSGFLGIDLRTRGLAVYRLLDAVVSFHRGLPAVGETVVYDIHIDEFVKQGEVWLFRFRFDGTVNGEPFITMRNGVAGFFTAEALAAGKGIVQTAFDKKPMPRKLPPEWRNFVEQKVSSLSAEQVEALRTGNLVDAFGTDFARVNLSKPFALPGGMLKLVDRVPVIDPAGGRFGLGFVRAEFDIHPDDWFLTCHFVDDMVMPGTLMYECCLHTLRILLMRNGWVSEAEDAVCEPVSGVQSRLKCRGQVTASTKVVTYEVTVKELGYGPEPYCFADALMYADGKPIVEITNMTLRMSGLTLEKLEAIWAGAESTSSSPGAPLYDSSRILAFSNGNPSEAFGEPYRVFDHGRVIARLPGPPYQFLDCITAVTGTPFVMKAGASCEAKYEVPETAWYFTANRCEKMPFSVLLEIGLQPCGWLAAYCGSALTSAEDLSFRNLGGKAIQFRAVTPESGMLTTNVKLTNVSSSAGMIIQHYDMRVSDSVGPLYEGTTYFGFFSKSALADQVGIRDAKVQWPSKAEKTRVEAVKLPRDMPFPGPMLRMIDRVEYIADGGKAGLGLIVGKIAVDPKFWFFGAHFYQDPVWPGSLGLESFLQLLKFAAWKRWKDVPDGGYQTVALNRTHSWIYRGQVLPSDKEVQVVLEITARDDRTHSLTANGFLNVDTRVIYQMTDFTLE
jgi:acyl transferase domain-containing protein/3-hydroxymyristoyl/3-hydroxydecanoyl-(acyl carrier protein) dehydratase